MRWKLQRESHFEHHSLEHAARKVVVDGKAVRMKLSENNNDNNRRHLMNV